MIEKAKEKLKQVFGFDEFISIQEQVIKSILMKKDTLVIMPTGGGKSICFQIPALVVPGLAVVVSPLISLMKDQVEQLKDLGVSAVLLNSSLSSDEYRANMALIKKDKVKLLYVAPETLLKSGILDMLSSTQVNFLAIDEAHCISEWGHDFRPEYRQLAGIRKRFNNATCIALTATATPRVQEDIQKNLDFKIGSKYIASFNRENLFLQIDHKVNPFEQAIDFISGFPNESGIIYCATRKQVDSLYTSLSEKGFSVKPYHAGLPEEYRRKNQDLFINDDIRIMIATIAFGMGIDKPNVRFVLHYDLPKNIEGYYQEIGRAGRDNVKSYCLMLFGYGDIQKIRYFINQKTDHERRISNIHLKAMLQFVETDICRRIPLLKYFGEEFPDKKCNICDNCLAGKKEKSDITITAQKFLSCVKRTGEMFGSAHIIDVLKGSKSKKVFKFNHQNLSTYDIGGEYSKNQWHQISRQLLHNGLMEQDMEFGGLKLTPKAWDVLRGKEKVMGIIEEDKKPEPIAVREDLDFNHDLFEMLREKRKKLADAANVPPYVVFSDKTLIEMAAYFPKTKDQLITVHGVGAAKLEKYGNDFLGIIFNYCSDNKIETKVKGKKTKPVPDPSRQSKKRHAVVGESYNAGKSVADLMAEYDVKLSTILDHLYKYCKEGNDLKVNGILEYSTLAKGEKERVLNAFDRDGPEFLGPVFRACDGKISYDELKILRLYYINKD